MAAPLPILLQSPYLHLVTNARYTSSYYNFSRYGGYVIVGLVSGFKGIGREWGGDYEEDSSPIKGRS